MTGGEDTEIAAQSSNGRLGRTATVATAAVAVFLFAAFGQCFAQSLGALGQLLGGGSSRHQQSSSQSNSGVTVQRNDAPFVGKFVGRQKQPSYETDMNAEFACYPATDAALPQTKTFVCYTAGGRPAQSQSGLPE
jgi:hypothetical protein